MKKTITWIILIVALTIFATSCTDDDKGEQKTYAFVDFEIVSPETKQEDYLSGSMQITVFNPSNATLSHLNDSASYKVMFYPTSIQKDNANKNFSAIVTSEKEYSCKISFNYLSISNLQTLSARKLYINGEEVLPKYYVINRNDELLNVYSAEEILDSDEIYHLYYENFAVHDDVHNLFEFK